MKTALSKGGIVDADLIACVFQKTAISEVIHEGTDHGTAGADQIGQFLLSQENFQ